MKKVFLILTLCMFSICVNTNEANADQRGIIPCSINEDELEIGDYVVRPIPCPYCNCYGWVVEDKFEDGRYKFACVVCGQHDLG